MAEYLVESYVASPDAVACDAGRVREAVAELARAGMSIRFVRSIFVPEDETCLFLIEADSSEVVREVARRAALPFEHVVETAPETDREETFQ